MITTSEAVHVAAARSSSSTGEVATVESPSTRIGEARWRLETRDVRMGAVEYADVGGRPQANPIGEGVAEVECPAEHELFRTSEVEAAAQTESKEADARAAVPAILGGLELLRAGIMYGEQAQRHHGDDDYSHATPLSPLSCVARWIEQTALCAPPCDRSPRVRTLQWPRWPTRDDECRPNPRWPPPV